MCYDILNKIIQSKKKKKKKESKHSAALHFQLRNLGL